MFWSRHRARDKAAAIRREAESERAKRSLRLTPELVTFWTEVVRAAASVPRKPSAQPCDYAPWIDAFHEAAVLPGIRWDKVGMVRPEWPPGLFGLILSDVAQPAWPEPRRDLIEFALTVLEADPMLFRSGYCKRHLIHRLRQSPLSDADVAGIEVMLHRAVIDGTGLEEYRAWCRLAGHLVADGRLPELAGWLAAESETPHAYVMDGGKSVRANRFDDLPRDKAQRNAWRMLDHLLRRCGADILG